MAKWPRPRLTRLAGPFHFISRRQCLVGAIIFLLVWQMYYPPMQQLKALRSSLSLAPGGMRQELEILQHHQGQQQQQLQEAAQLLPEQQAGDLPPLVVWQQPAVWAVDLADARTQQWTHLPPASNTTVGILHWVNKVATPDLSPRCLTSHICETDESEQQQMPQRDHESKQQQQQQDVVGTECGYRGLACKTTAESRRIEIRNAARWSWKGYRDSAWGHDEMGVNQLQSSSNSATVDLGSRSGSSSSSSEHSSTHSAGVEAHKLEHSYRAPAPPIDWLHLGLTIVDGLDTLLLMGLSEEYAQARDWVAQHLDFDVATPVSVFETTIRVLGSLLSTFYLSGGDQLYLRKAEDLGKRLLEAMKTETGVATETVSLNRSRSHLNEEASFWQAIQLQHVEGQVGRVNVAAAGTLTMEMSTLSRITGRPEFAAAAFAFWKLLPLLETCDGLYCTWFDGETMTCAEPLEVGMGPSTDSLYEYMLKQWVLSGFKDQQMLALYTRAMRGMRRHLVAEVYPEDRPESPFWTLAVGERHPAVPCSCEAEVKQSRQAWLAQQNRRQEAWRRRRRPVYRSAVDLAAALLGHAAPRRLGWLGAVQRRVNAWLQGWFSRGLHSSGSASYGGRQWGSNTAPAARSNSALAVEDRWQALDKRLLKEVDSQQLAQVNNERESVGLAGHLMENDSLTASMVTGQRQGRASLTPVGRRLQMMRGSTTDRRAASAVHAAPTPVHRSRWVPRASDALRDGTRNDDSKREPLEHLSSAAEDNTQGTESVMAGAGGKLGPTGNHADNSANGGWQYPDKPPVLQKLWLEHLACFVPGLLVLGHTAGISTSIPADHLSPPPPPSAPPASPPATSGTDDSTYLEDYGTLPQPYKRKRQYTKLTGVAARTPAEALVVDDLLLAARLMPACYDLYRLSSTGVAPDAVAWLPMPPGGRSRASYDTAASMALPKTFSTTVVRVSRSQATPQRDRTDVETEDAGGTDIASKVPVQDILLENTRRQPLQMPMQLPAGAQARPKLGKPAGLNVPVGDSKSPRRRLASAAGDTAQLQTKQRHLAAASVVVQPIRSGKPTRQQLGRLEQSRPQIGQVDVAEAGQVDVAEQRYRPLRPDDQAKRESASSQVERQQQQQQPVPQQQGGRHQQPQQQREREGEQQQHLPPDSASSSNGSRTAAEQHILYQQVVRSPGNYLRPEVVESLWYLWVATRDQVYREWGWAIFRAFEQYSRVDTGGYARLQRATDPDGELGDRQESFWLAETLKYLYLLFNDEALPLEHYVFNTEAHPLPLWGSRAERVVLQRLGITPLDFDPWQLEWAGAADERY